MVVPCTLLQDSASPLSVSLAIPAQNAGIRGVAHELLQTPSRNVIDISVDDSLAAFARLNSAFPAMPGSTPVDLMHVTYNIATTRCMNR